MNDVSVGKYHPAGGTSYSLLGPGDVVGEVAFFTEVPQLEVSGCGLWVVCGGGHLQYVTHPTHPHCPPFGTTNCC